MQIGFNLPISGPLSAPETVIRMAQEGEALGYDYLTLTAPIELKAVGCELVHRRTRQFEKDLVGLDRRQ